MIVYSKIKIPPLILCRGYHRLWSVFTNHYSGWHLCLSTVVRMKHIITAGFHQTPNRLQEKPAFQASPRSMGEYFSLHICFYIWSMNASTLIVGKDSDGKLFVTCVWNKGVLCASTRSPQNRLTALWAVGRFLPRWASSPAWQRRLDVIKVYTLSAVWGCVKWALLLPKAWTVAVYLHRSCEISKTDLQHTRPELCIHLCSVVYLQHIGFPDVFFLRFLHALLF